MQSTPDIPIQQGQVIENKYRIDRILGRGGMGVVVEATHLVLEEQVAIKFLLPSFATNEEVVTRFVREAKAAIKIRSEHVARVMDVSATGASGPFLVMEYLRGKDLSQVLESQGPLPVRDAVGYVLQACEALGEAHAQGIVHRDIKPANLFLCTRADGTACVKVLDFGISKVAIGGEDSSLTKTQGMMGSPLYMSPEQARSARDTTVRSDIWSMGIVLYELLTGQTPFGGETLMELCVNLLQRVPSPPSTFAPHLPAGLDAVVMKCLEKDPSSRYQNMAELAAALAPFGVPGAWNSANVTARVLGINPMENAERIVASPAESPPFDPALMPPPPASAAQHPAAHITGGLTSSAMDIGQLQTGAPSETVGSWEAQRKPSSSKGAWIALGLVGAFLTIALIGGSGYLLWNTNAKEPAATASPLPSATEDPPELPEPKDPIVVAVPTESAPASAASSAPAPSSATPAITKAPPPIRPNSTTRLPKPPPASTKKDPAPPKRDLDLFGDSK